MQLKKENHSVSVSESQALKQLTKFHTTLSIHEAFEGHFSAHL
jgi:hypothetical protein